MVGIGRWKVGWNGCEKKEGRKWEGRWKVDGMGVGRSKVGW